MTAGPNGNNRASGRDLVKIPAVGHPFCIGKIVLIPASAQNPAFVSVPGIFFSVFLQIRNHLFQAVRVLRQKRLIMTPGEMAVVDLPTGRFDPASAREITVHVEVSA